MDPLVVIQAAAFGINALLDVIGKLKSQSGLTDEQIAAQFESHGTATQAAIAGYLKNL